MARFELTISDGEKILINRPTGEMQDLLAELKSSNFLLLSEIRMGTSAAAQDVIVASHQITLVRSVDSDSRQNTTFRPKR